MDSTTTITYVIERLVRGTWVGDWPGYDNFPEAERRYDRACAKWPKEPRRLMRVTTTRQTEIIGHRP